MTWVSGNTIQVRVITSQNGQLCYANFWYGDPLADGSLDIFEALATWESSVMPLWLDVISANHSYVKTIVTRRGNPNPGQEFEKVYNTPGNVAGESLPVFTTWSFTKYPDLDTQDPSSAADFRAGRVAVSGIPEALQENGYAISSAVGSLNALAAALLVLPAGTNNPALQMFMHRPANTIPASPGSANVWVGSIYFNEIGTQNTRK